MNELSVFTNPEFGEIRTLEENGEVLFCGSDVAKALGYAKPQNAIAAHCKGALKRGTLTEGGTQELLFIHEGDVYRLTARSKLPTAERFERWVFDEVLPTIRRHGAYMTPETIEKAILNPEFIIQLAQKLKEEMELRKVAEEQVHLLDLDNRRMRPKADYFDALVSKNLLTSLRETAKLFHVKEKRMIRFLLDNKFLYRAPSGKLLPYAHRPSDGLFVVKEANDEKNGWFGVQTFVTPRGRETFRLLLEGKPESGLWGRPGEEEVPDMTEGDAYRMEEYYTKTARKNSEA